MMHSHVVVMINNGLMISERWPRENCFTGTEKKMRRLYFMWKLLGIEGQIFDDITEFKTKPCLLPNIPENFVFVLSTSDKLLIRRRV